LELRHLRRNVGDLLVVRVELVGRFLRVVANEFAAVKPLAVGAQIPDGRLRDLNGEELGFLKTATEKPSVVIFYRGGWCPYCNIQMEQLITLEPRLKVLGYQILAISPDSPASMRESLKKHAINYRLLSDSTLALTQKFGLAWKVGKMENFIKKIQGINLVKASGQDKLWLPVPAAFVIDRKGRITYEFYDPNYTRRVDPEELYQAAQKALQ
jgi:peroxiredoxin